MSWDPGSLLQPDNPLWTEGHRFWVFAAQFEDPLQFPYGADPVVSAQCTHCNYQVYKYMGHEDGEWTWGKVLFQHRDPEKHKKWKIRLYYQTLPEEQVVRVWEHCRGGLCGAVTSPITKANETSFWHWSYCVKCGDPAPLRGDTPDSSDSETESQRDIYVGLDFATDFMAYRD